MSKPFVFALVCQAVGEDAARDKLGVNSTGLPGVSGVSGGLLTPLTPARAA